MACAKLCNGAPPNVEAFSPIFRCMITLSHINSVKPEKNGLTMYARTLDSPPIPLNDGSFLWDQIKIPESDRERLHHHKPREHDGRASLFSLSKGK